MHYDGPIISLIPNERTVTMSLTAMIRASYEMPSSIVRGYLDDLTDDDLFVRPHENMNHIAWQLGHLLVGENHHMNAIKPDSMPALPEGFAERHAKETATSDDRSQFNTKAEYLQLMEQQRQATFAVLDGLTEEQLAGPSPEAVNYLGPTVSAIFTGESTHWMMHAGQWAVVRRKLGKPPLF
jgi:hypothetical protein